MRTLRCVAIGLAAMTSMLGAPTMVQAQAVGTVTGQIVETGTLRPVGGAQVVIPGTGLGGLANNNGRYLLTNVPVGEVTLQVQVIGYGTAQQSVTVAAGQTVTADFELRTQALGLDEIIVTGTAGGQQRRAVANLVDDVELENRLETMAPSNLSQMLSGQVAGANIQVGGGNIGSGGNISIRGMSTMDLNSTPLVYVDGIRVDSNADLTSSRLNDLVAADIDRVEVIKGPAAATLYGTEATNGVIQIFTKKGRAGTATVDVTIGQGANWFMNAEDRIPLNHYLRPDGTVVTQNLIEDEKARGTPIFRTGHAQTYGANVRGGREGLTYYLSGTYSDEEGYDRSNEQTRTTVRANLQLAAAENLDLSADMGMVRSDLSYEPDSGDNDMRRIIRGLPETVDTPLRGFPSVPPEIAKLVQNDEELNRGTFSVTATHRPTSWFTQRFVGGFDWTDGARSTFSPRLDDITNETFGINELGSKSIQHTRRLHQTYDYNATASFDLSSIITSATTVGLQYFTSGTRTSEAEGEDLPTPAVSTVSSAAVTEGSESFSENKTLGTFIQQTFGWRNQAFFTAAIRADGNSAFGESFDAAYYPKVGATWVVSDAAFWDIDFIESLRLRTAWGKSGLQPATFAAIRTYSPTTGPGDQSTISPENLGNPDLKPEVGSELELGFDASLLGDRLNVEFTHYRQRTTDLIVEELVAPSIGFAGERYINIGEVQNRGYEFSIRGRPISTPSVELVLTASAGHNKNKLISLAGRQVQADTRGRWQHVEGYELGSMWSKYIATAEYGPDNELVNVTCRGAEQDNFAPLPCADAPFHYVGNPGPTWTGGFGQTLTLGSRLTLNASWVFNLNTRRYSTDNWARENTLQNSATAIQRLQGTLDPVVAAGYVTTDVEHQLMYRDDFVRLRDVSASYTLPDNFVQGFGVNRASLTVSGRNLWHWAHPEFQDAKLYDPEVKAVRTAPWPGWEQARMPLSATVTTTIRLTF